MPATTIQHAWTANQTAILDSGAELSAFRLYPHLPPTGPSSTSIILPNGTTAQPLGTRAYTVAGIPIRAHIFKKEDLHSSLISAYDICAQKHSILLKDTGATIIDPSGRTILHAPKQTHSQLWSLPIVDHHHQPPIQNAVPPHCTAATMNIISNSTHAERTAYASASMGSPTDAALLAAFSKAYIDMHGITPKMIRQNPPRSIATAQGHMKIHRKGIRSTKQISQPHRERSPSSHTSTIATNLFSASDIAGGKFPVTSTTGKNYILVSAYKNYIHLEALPLLHGTVLQKALAETIDFFTQHGHRPPEHRMDNQTSREIHDFLTKESGINVQYYPPGDHRANPAERHIQTVKAHLTSMLATSHPEFPYQLWDKLLPLAEIQLNLLRPFGPDPLISAYEGIIGKYDFNAHPLHPAGSRVMVHEPNRLTWGDKATSGFYLGPARGHYRCAEIYDCSTGHVRCSGNFQVFPNKLLLPGSSRADTFEKALTDFLRSHTKHTELLEATRKLMQDISNHPLAATTVLNQPAPLPAPTLPPPDQRVITPTPTTVPPPTPQAQRVIAPAPTTEPTPAPPVQRVQPTYAYTPFDTDQMQPAHRKAAKALIGKTFVDEHDNVTFQITAIVSPQGKSTPYLRYYDIHTYPHGPPSEDEQEYQPLSEILYKPRTSKQYILRPPTKTQHYRFINSIFHSRIGDPLLNVNPAGGKLTFKAAITGPDSAQWLQASDLEIRRLITSKTIRPIHRRDQPLDRRADTTYFSPQVKEKLDDNGDKTRRVRGTLGGDRINYTGDTLSEVADPVTVNLHQQSVLADLKTGLSARYVTIDLKDYYLGCSLHRPEYLLIPIKHMTATTIADFSLHPYVSENKILFEVNGSMYGHPAAGRIAQTEFKALVKAHDYYEHPDVPCLFLHRTRPTSFTLIVDDLGIKIFSENDLQHLIDTIKTKWDVKVDRTGAKYNGIRLLWDYDKRTLITDIPNYVTEGLAKLQLPPHKMHATPAPFIAPIYGQEQTLPDPLADIPATPEEAKLIERIHGVFLYYARTVDFMLKPALLDIATEMHSPTKRTFARAMHLAGFAQKYPNTQIMFEATDMILRIQSDASHHRLPNSRSVAGGIHYLVNTDSPIDAINGPVQTICKQIAVSVCASATESEYAALFMNGQAACFPLLVLKALGYNQPSPTTIYCDNLPAQGIANRTVTLRRSKAIHTRYNWIRDRVDQGQFTIGRMPGNTIDADYLTKIHPRPKQEYFMKRLTYKPFHNKA